MATELTASQQSALEQLQQITTGEDPDRELAVLESVGWNVERAVQAFFEQEDTTTAAAASSASPANASRSASTPAATRTVEQFSVDDSAQGTDNSTFAADRLPPRRGVAPAYPGRGPPRSSWLSVISFPFTLVGGLLGFIFRLLRIPFIGLSPYFLRSAGGGAGLRPGFGRSLTEDPTKVAERFVRELEDETGALTVSHAAQEKHSDESGAPSSSSTAGQKRLPDFFIGSYDQALKAAESDLKVLCVIIQSSEHDDVPQFRRTVLTDSDFVKTVTDNDFIVWAGDIRQRDAYQASHKLGSTTYPFVAFLALHPVPAHLGGGSRGSSTPRLTVLSRHEGSPTTVTSAHSLTTHITTSVLPRVTPLLTRLRTERWNRAQERTLREEQDQAFALAAARDKERVEKRMAEERAVAEAVRQREAEKVALEKKRADVVNWRRYARKNLVPPEPTSASGAGSPVGSVRVGVRLPDGKRTIRRFAEDDTASALYAYVETLFIPSEFEASTDPEDPPKGYGEHEWSFQLVTSYPRKEIPAGWDVELGSIAELKGGANLALEMKAGFGAVVEDEDDDSSEGESD